MAQCSECTTGPDHSHSIGAGDQITEGVMGVPDIIEYLTEIKTRHHEVGCGAPR
jgi:hypothetical protein